MILPETVRNYSVEQPLLSRQRKAVFEQDGELCLGHAPFAGGIFHSFRCQVQHHEEELQMERCSVWL